MTTITTMDAIIPYNQNNKKQQQQQINKNKTRNQFVCGFRSFCVRVDVCFCFCALCVFQSICHCQHLSIRNYCIFPMYRIFRLFTRRVLSVFFFSSLFVWSYIRLFSPFPHISFRFVSFHLISHLISSSLTVYALFTLSPLSALMNVQCMMIYYMWLGFIHSPHGWHSLFLVLYCVCVCWVTTIVSEAD